MAITGTTFDLMRVTPDKDALLYHALAQGNDKIITGYKNELAVRATGLNVYVNTGAAIVQGRLIEVTSEERITVTANKKGFICLMVDLTQSNTATGTPGSADYNPVNKQVRVSAVDALTLQDLHTTGKVYTYPLAEYSSNGTAVVLTPRNPAFTKTIAMVDGAEMKGVKSGLSNVTTTLDSNDYTVTSPYFKDNGGWIEVLKPCNINYRLTGMSVTVGTNWRDLSFLFQRNGQPVTSARNVVGSQNGGVIYTEGYVSLKKGDLFIIQTNGDTTAHVRTIKGIIEVY